MQILATAYVSGGHILRQVFEVLIISYPLIAYMTLSWDSFTITVRPGLCKKEQYVS